MSDAQRRAEILGPLAVAGGLLVLLSGPLAVCWFAHAYPDPLVVPDAWQAEKRLSDDVRATRLARELGLSLAVTASQGEGGVRVAARVVDASGLPRSATRASVHSASACR